MAKNKTKQPFSQKASQYLKENTARAIIILISLIALCLVIFGIWIYMISFMIPQKPASSEVMQKRLSINSKLYTEVMEQLQKKDPTQEYKDPFAD